MFYQKLSALLIQLFFLQVDSAYSYSSPFPSNLHHPSQNFPRQIFEGCSEAIYQNNCLNSTIPEAIKQTMNECLPSVELAKTMWDDFLLFTEYENFQAIENTFELFDLFFLVFSQDQELMLVISKSICNIGKNSIDTLPNDYHDRIIAVVSNLTSAEHYQIAEDLIVCLNNIVYSSETTKLNEQIEIKEHNYWYKSNYVNLDNASTLTIQINSEIQINNESDSSNYLANILLSSYGENQVYDIFVTDLVTGSLKTLPVKVIIKNDFSSDYIVCKKYLIAEWERSLCSITEISNDKVYMTSESPGIFSIFENCSSTFIPEAIAISLIGLALVITPIFIALDRYKQNKQISTYSTSYKPDLQNSDIKEAHSTETNEILALKESFIAFFISTHLLLAIKKANHLKRLKILLIYINSIVIQLGFVLFLFYNRRHNYYNSVIIAIIAASVAGVLSYIVCFLKIENPTLQKLIFCADAAIGIVCAINIFIRDAGCTHVYWLSAFLGSMFVDLVVMQTCLVLIRRFFSSINVKRHKSSQSE